MILVVGATGSLGGLITRKLLEAGENVRILVRSRSPHDQLCDLGAEPVVGDLKDPPSLEVACAGVDAVVTTATAAARGGDDTTDSVDRIGNANLIRVAAAAGVHKFVFTSVFGAATDAPSDFVCAKAEAEEQLHQTGMAWTVLRPDAFMNTWFPMVVGGPALSRQTIFLAVRESADTRS